MATPKEQAAKILDSFKQFWAKQEKKNKILYISGLAAAIIIAIVVAVVLNKKDYVVLFKNLESDEASQIVSIIRETGYECTLTGGTITVPEGTENALYMALAQQGYPKSSLTYPEYNEKVGMFTTESEKKEYARQAMENRLSAIITSLEPVKSATVTLSIPEQKNTVIAAYQNDPTASVKVEMKDDSTTLSDKQIIGVTYLVKHSIAGLKEENIFITDSFGMPLIADEADGDVIAKETRKLRFKTTLENILKDKIVGLLAPAYTEEGFSVAVNAVLNFDSKVSEDTKYTPSTEDERGMLQEAKSENATGYATADGGVVGVETNADDTYPTGNTRGNGQWSEQSVDNIYLVNTYKEQVEKQGYTIDDLSVSVIIYTDYLPDTTKQDLVSLVGNAASINPLVINDVVTVASLPKAGEEAIPASERTYLWGLTLNQLIILAAVLLGVLLILVLILALVSRKAKKKREAFEKEIIEANTSGAENPLVEHFIPLEEPIADRVSIPSLINGDEMESKEAAIRQEISEFASQRPEIVAQLLRAWMSNEIPATGSVSKGKKSEAENGGSQK